MTWRFPICLSVTVALLAVTPSAIAGNRPHPYVSLGRGHFGKYAWAVRAKRPEGREGAGPHGAQRPFLAVGVEEPASADPIEQGMVFGGHSPFPGYLTARGEPLVVTNLGFHGASVRMTAVALAFAPAARRIRFTFPDGSHETTRLRALNPRQARKTQLERFRYTAFAVPGGWCYEELASFNARGAKLWSAGEDELSDRGVGRGSALREGVGLVVERAQLAAGCP